MPGLITAPPFQRQRARAPGNVVMTTAWKALVPLVFADPPDR